MRTLYRGQCRPVRRIALAAASLLLLTALCFVAYSLLVAAGAIEPGSSPFATECRPSWRAVEPTRPSPVYNELHGVDVVSPTLGWAVGTYGEEDFALPLIERWDGETWSAVDAPSIPDFSNHIYSVSANSSTDAWAVGASHRGTELWRTMALHWDGRAWTIVDTPTVGEVSSLNAVAGVAPNEVWAVGETSSGRKGLGTSALAMRWDGSAWKIVDTGVRLTDSTLNGVAAVASNDVWAVGSYSDASGTVHLPLALHWNGTDWSRVAVPGEGVLWSVSAVSSREVWAVGNFGPQSLALGWYGESWTRVPSPNPGKSSVLYSVSAQAGEAWAAGSHYDNSHDVPYVARWSDGKWREVSVPPAGRISDTLWGIDVVGQTGWAVGSSIQDGQGNNAPVTFRLNNPCRK